MKSRKITQQRIYEYLRKKAGIYFRKSYSQCGEDLIVSYIFNVIKIKKPTYLDIGAHHPYYLNNTYLFYKRGCKGVNVEPDPELFKSINRVRKNDVNLNVGVASKRGSLELNVFSSRTLNTFSEVEAKKYLDLGHDLISTQSVEIITVDDIFPKYFNVAPDYLSLDTEGMDVEILQSIDNTMYKPAVYCVETITYSINGQGKKISEIDELMIDRGYFKYADTYINSIYVDKERWIEGGQ